MINATDLRVGNIFIREIHTSRGSEYDHEFILTENEMGKLFSDDLSLALQDLSGIPLTEDILLKCGSVSQSFKLGENSELFVCTLVSGTYNAGKAIIYIHGAPMYDFECLYLHTLQNAIFALTNKELVIEL